MSSPASQDGQKEFKVLHENPTKDNQDGLYMFISQERHSNIKVGKDILGTINKPRRASQRANSVCVWVNEILISKVLWNLNLQVSQKLGRRG